MRKIINIIQWIIKVLGYIWIYDVLRFLKLWYIDFLKEACVRYPEAFISNRNVVVVSNRFIDLNCGLFTDIHIYIYCLHLQVRTHINIYIWSWYLSLQYLFKTYKNPAQPKTIHHASLTQLYLKIALD